MQKEKNSEKVISFPKSEETAKKQDNKASASAEVEKLIHFPKAKKETRFSDKPSPFKKLSHAMGDASDRYGWSFL